MMGILRERMKYSKELKELQHEKNSTNPFQIHKSE